MFCVHCGVENPEIGRFCRSCGKALIADTGLSQERLYTTDILASENTHPNTQEAVTDTATQATTETQTSKRPIQRDPCGVGGWLLFLCVILTFVFPIQVVHQMILALRSRLGILDLIYVLVYLGIAIFSFTAGILLWRVRPNAVATAKLFLLAQVAFAISLYVKVSLGSVAAASPDSAQSLAGKILLDFYCL